MSVFNDFVNGALPYQSYWLPAAIGGASAILCLGIANLVGRGRRVQASATVVTGAGQHDPFEQGSLTEKRRALRRSGNPVNVVYARQGETVATNHALVLDRSLGGLRLAAEEEIPEGTELRLLPTNASEQTPWIQVRILGCRQVEDSWELHCQFLKTPPWSVLLMFG